MAVPLRRDPSPRPAFHLSPPHGRQGSIDLWIFRRLSTLTLMPRANRPQVHETIALSEPGPIGLREDGYAYSPSHRTTLDHHLAQAVRRRGSRSGSGGARS